MVSRLCLIMIILLIARTAGAEVYQWKDEQGRVHFSDRPVSDRAKTVEIRQPAGSSTPTLNEAERKQKRQRLLDVYQEDRARKKEKKEKERLAKQDRKRRCKAARGRYDDLSRAGGLYNMNDKGERVFLSHDEREKYLARLKQEVKHWCGN